MVGAIKKLALGAGADPNPGAKSAAKDAAKNPEIAFIARLDRDGDSLISKREYEIWARNYAEYQAELAVAQQQIADAERRLQAKNLTHAMRLQYEVARRNVWASYHALHQQHSYFNHMQWMQRHLVTAAKRK